MNEFQKKTIELAKLLREKLKLNEPITSFEDACHLIVEYLDEAVE